MTRKDKEELIKSWKEDEVAGPAGDVELGDSDLENASGGANTEYHSTCEFYTSGCCEPEVQ